MILSGIVISDQDDLRGIEPLIVVVIPERQMESNDEFDLVRVKNWKPYLEKNKNKQTILPVGTIIKWEKTVGDVDFNKCTVCPLGFPTTSKEAGQYQISLDGVIHSTKNLVYFFYKFPPLKIPAHMRNKAMRDVSISFWVSFYFNFERKCLIYELYDYHDVAYESQEEVRNMFWNRSRVENITCAKTTYNGENIIKENVKDFEYYPLILNQRKGIVVSKRSILFSDCPDYVITYPLKSKTLPPVGTPVVFDAIWLPVVGIYGITHVKVDNNAAKPPPLVDYLKKAISLSEVPGVYICKSLKITLDDPLRCLDFLPFTSFATANLYVSVAEGCPNRLGRARYYIKTLVGKKQEKIQELLARTEISFNEEGIIIEDNLVHIPKYPQFEVEHDENIEAFPPGTFVIINCIYDKEEKMMKCMSIRKKEKTPIPTETGFDRDCDTEKIGLKITATGLRDFPKFLYHPVFGLIEPPVSFNVPIHPQLHQYEDILIVSNDMPTEDLLKQPAKFKSIVNLD